MEFLDKTPTTIKQKALDFLNLLAMEGTVTEQKASDAFDLVAMDDTITVGECSKDTPKATRTKIIEVINFIMEKSEEDTIDLLAGPNPSTLREKVKSLPHINRLRLMLKFTTPVRRNASGVKLASGYKEDEKEANRIGSGDDIAGGNGKSECITGARGNVAEEGGRDEVKLAEMETIKKGHEEDGESLEDRKDMSPLSDGNLGGKQSARKKIQEEIGSKKYTETARQNAQTESFLEKEVLNLPKDLCEEIKAMGVGKNEGSMRKKDISYKEIVTGEIPKGEEKMTKENVEFMPSSRSKTQLKYYTSEEGPISLCPDESIVESLNYCVVGYFLGGRLPFWDVEKEMKSIWQGIVEVQRNEKGFFFIKFRNEKEMEKFLDNGYCYVFSRLMVLKKWHCMLKLDKEAVELIPIWVRLYDVPLEFWSSHNLSKLASKIGRPLYIDQATKKMLRVTYARVCVEIDASKDLPSTLQIKYGDDIVDVEVKYQWLPSRCGLCNVFGHKETNCYLRKETKKEHRNDKRKPHYHNKFRTSQEWYKNEGTESWQIHAGKKRTTKIIDRRGNLARTGEFKSKYVEVEKGKETLKVSNHFEVIADSITEQTCTTEKTEGEPSTAGIEMGEAKKEANGGNMEEIEMEGESEQENGTPRVMEKSMNESMDDDNIIINISPSKNPIGFSVKDYPKDWSRKKVKKEIKAKRNALEASQRKKEKGRVPP